MGYGIVNIAGNTRKQAMAGLRENANSEEQRKNANENIKNAERTQTMSAVGTGLTAGAMVGGPVGAVIGGLGGFIAGELF
ncbi:bacteriocin [Vibrio breoganii]|uniref:Bacteriocin n=1 Tax=Vibrio breoganii TaxID=553239 RepID=A0AAP8MWP4_9VIBR|nr:bacteriocin [Vibrio breoganii]PMP10201.1 bacteriocin [Vibrio breoganii]